MKTKQRELDPGRLLGRAQLAHLLPRKWRCIQPDSTPAISHQKKKTKKKHSNMASNGVKRSEGLLVKVVAVQGQSGRL